MSKSGHSHGVRADIQALRALAIASVVIFHIWPGSLTGGFVGVDIFFVISGYLITGQLWRQEQRTGRVDFADFWARRARRLLPASLLAIVITTAATYLVTSHFWFLKVANEATGATLYAQNWVLISKVTNYLTDDGTKSPFQHFWSLSVEEQYYIFWPVVLFLAILAVRALPKFLKNRPLLITVLALILVSSLAFSIHQTTANPQDAYFNTFTRAWEFAAGALLAVASRSDEAAAKAKSPVWFWLGTGLMFYAIFRFTNATPFPSWYAGIPVLGAVLALHGGQSDSRWIPRFWLTLKPIQFLGDTSYSLYLWHWPVLILAPFALRHPLGLVDQLAVAGIAVVLGYLSKTYVEDPVRFGPLSRLKVRTQLASVGLAMAVIVGSILVATPVVKAQFNSDVKAMGLNPPLNALTKGAKAAEDITHCNTSREGTTFFTCQRGDVNGKIRVGLIGDSHTREWWVPVDDMALKYHWNLTVISKSACNLQDPVTYAVGITHPSCQGWNAKLLDYLNTQAPFDLIINSNSSFVNNGKPEAAAAFRDLVTKITANGHTKFLLIHDNPKPNPNFVDCIETYPNQAATKCSVTRAKGLTPPDVFPAAVAGVKNVLIADFTESFCSLKSCPPIVGNIVVYKDNSHITSTWAKHLEPALDALIPAEFKK
ncbi:MAG: acyltransferase family protein [Micrococcales bacterium]